MNLTQEVDKLIRPVIEKMGYQLMEVAWHEPELRVVIGKKDGRVSVEDCAQVSRAVDPLLDKENLIRKKYFLVVSSAGIE